MSRSTSLAATQVGQRKNAGSNLDKQQFNKEGTFPQDCRQPNPCIGKLPWKPSLARNLKLRLMKYSWFIQHRQTQADCFAACQGSTRLEEALAWQERSGRWFSGSERDLQHASPPGTNHMFSYVFFALSREPCWAQELFRRTKTLWLSLLLAALKFCPHIIKQENIHVFALQGSACGYSRNTSAMLSCQNLSIYRPNIEKKYPQSVETVGRLICPHELCAILL